MSTRASGACSCRSITSCPRPAKLCAAVLASGASCRTLRPQPPLAPGQLWKSTSSNVSSKTSASASPRYGGFFEYERKQERLEEVARELEDPTIWSNPARAQELGRERARLSADVGEIDRATQGIDEAAELP